MVLAPGSHPAEVDYLVERSERAEPLAGERAATALRVIWDINRPALMYAVAEIAAEVRAGLYEKAVLASVREIETAATIDPRSDARATARGLSALPPVQLPPRRRHLPRGQPRAAGGTERRRGQHARPRRFRPPRPHRRGGRGAGRGAAARRQGAHRARDRRARPARGRRRPRQRPRGAEPPGAAAPAQHPAPRHRGAGPGPAGRRHPRPGGAACTRRRPSAAGRRRPPAR